MSDVGVFVIIVIVEIAIVIIVGIFCLPCFCIRFTEFLKKKPKQNSSPTAQASTLAMQNLTNNNSQTTISNPNDLVLNSEVVLNPKPKRTNTLNPPDSRDASLMNPFIIRMMNR